MSISRIFTYLLITLFSAQTGNGLHSLTGSVEAGNYTYYVRFFLFNSDNSILWHFEVLFSFSLIYLLTPLTSEFLICYLTKFIKLSSPFWSEIFWPVSSSFSRRVWVRYSFRSSIDFPIVVQIYKENVTLYLL